MRLLDDPIDNKPFAFDYVRGRDCNPPIAAHTARNLIISIPEHQFREKTNGRGIVESWNRGIVERGIVACHDSTFHDSTIPRFHDSTSISFFAELMLRDGDDKITCRVGRDRWIAVTPAHVVKGKGFVVDWIVQQTHSSS